MQVVQDSAMHQAFARFPQLQSGAAVGLIGTGIAIAILIVLMMTQSGIALDGASLAATLS